MQTRATQDQRFMMSPDGMQADWIHPLEIATRAPGWIDCTDLDDEEFQRLITERQAARPRIVGVAVGS